MDRYWLFTWRAYGTWFPGESGFVGQYVNETGQRVTDNTTGQPTAEPMPRLAEYARNILRSPAVHLSAVQAEAVRVQLLETAAVRGRRIDAIAVLTDHIHLVFGVTGDPNHDEMLSDWKAYASRALNRIVPANPERQRRGGRGSGRQRAGRRLWWAERGSTRILKTFDSRCAAIRYVRDQDEPLVVWLSDEARALLKGERGNRLEGEPGASATG